MSCSFGHTGPICGDCQLGFSKLGDICIECLDTSINMTRILLASFGYIIFLAIYALYYIEIISILIYFFKDFQSKNHKNYFFKPCTIQKLF